jgi:hypothetical protein
MRSFVISEKISAEDLIVAQRQKRQSRKSLRTSRAKLIHREPIFPLSPLEHSMMQITSLAAFVKAVEQIVDEWTPKGADWYLQPWFRGHGDASWSLEPGWYRSRGGGRGIGIEYYNEVTLLENFRLRAPTYLEQGNRVKKLCGD